MEKAGKGGLLLLWHGYTIPGIYFFRHRNYYSIVSLSKDGELQAKLLKSRGYNCIRGSSARQGIRALLEGIRTLKAGHIVSITPDGPKGPPKKVQSGSIHLAQKSGVPIIPLGVFSNPSWRLKSWDKHIPTHIYLAQYFFLIRNLLMFELLFRVLVMETRLFQHHF